MVSAKYYAYAFQVCRKDPFKLVQNKKVNWIALKTSWDGFYIVTLFTRTIIQTDYMPLPTLFEVCKVVQIYIKKDTVFTFSILLQGAVKN